MFLPRREGRQRFHGVCREQKSAGLPAGPDWNPDALAGICLPPEEQLCLAGVPNR